MAWTEQNGMQYWRVRYHAGDGHVASIRSVRARLRPTPQLRCTVATTVFDHSERSHIPRKLFLDVAGIGCDP